MIDRGLFLFKEEGGGGAMYLARAAFDRYPLRSVCYRPGLSPV